ncbi:YheC/YheD family protein [Neobacillus driksii]|uniref:YheC/YheD family protein n=1 Tax=Neobacillus driksii TaxID=3035913 RepID=UPI0035BE61A5
MLQCNNASLSFQKVHSHILKVCHSFCNLMEKREGHFAEFGLDIVLDEDGYPWIL